MASIMQRLKKKLAPAKPKPAKKGTKAKATKSRTAKKTTRTGTAKLARSAKGTCHGACRVRLGKLKLGEVRTRRDGKKLYEVVRVK